MTTEERLVLLMKNDYTVRITAKGISREFGMTYEVYSTVMLHGSRFTIIGFGETLDQALDSIIRQIESLTDQPLKVTEDETDVSS